MDVLDFVSRCRRALLVDDRHLYFETSVWVLPGPLVQVWAIVLAGLVDPTRIELVSLGVELSEVAVTPTDPRARDETDVLEH